MLPIFSVGVLLRSASDLENKIYYCGESGDLKICRDRYQKDICLEVTQGDKKTYFDIGNRGASFDELDAWAIRAKGKNVCAISAPAFPYSYLLNICIKDTGDCIWSQKTKEEGYTSSRITSRAIYLAAINLFFWLLFLYFYIEILKNDTNCTRVLLGNSRSNCYWE